MNSTELFESIYQCRVCFPAAEELVNNPDKTGQPNQPWLERPDSPVWAIGLEPQEYTTEELSQHVKPAEKEGVRAYRILLEENAHHSFDDPTLCRLRKLECDAGEVRIGVHNIVCCSAIKHRNKTKMHRIQMENVISTCVTHLKTGIEISRPKVVILQGKDAQSKFLGLYRHHLPPDVEPSELICKPEKHKQAKGFRLKPRRLKSGVSLPGFAVLIVPHLSHITVMVDHQTLLEHASGTIRELLADTWDQSVDIWTWEVSSL